LRSLDVLDVLGGLRSASWLGLRWFSTNNVAVGQPQHSSAQVSIHLRTLPVLLHCI